MSENGLFEITDRDGLARIGKFQTPHGIIETPTVMPVINPNLIVVTPKDMRKIGVNSIITNSYIIRRNEKLREAALKGGVHHLIDFDGPVMTDSGTFQSYVYGDIEFGNSDMLDFQRKIGSDICTILDLFSTTDDSYHKAKEAVDETYRRASELKEDGTIYAGTIQGSIYQDLRSRASRLMSRTAAKYLPIGGVVPLLESYSYEKLVKIIHHAKKFADFSKPIHLFGGGHPMFLALAVYAGVDVFDSASYVKYARDDRLIMPDRTVSLESLAEIPMWSPLSSKYSVGELKTLPEDERVRALSEHNLFSIFSEIREIRQRISDQTLRNYVASKARAHPSLLDAFRRHLQYRWNSRFEEYSKKSTFLYFRSEDEKHPIVQRIERFSWKMLDHSTDPVLLVDRSVSTQNVVDGSPLIEALENYKVHIVKDWNGIPVPIDLWDTYPIQQSISSYSMSENLPRTLKRRYPEKRIIIAETLNPDLSGLEKGRTRFHLEKLRSIARYQFPSIDANKMFPTTASIRISRNTGRIRTVSVEKSLIATLRAGDGLLTFTIDGAHRLLRALPKERNRVVVNDESRPFNMAGKNVFFKFILRCDRSIVPGNETLVVDSEGDLLAIGKATVSGSEMLLMKRGVAVKVHGGISHA